MPTVCVMAPSSYSGLHGDRLGRQEHPRHDLCRKTGQETGHPGRRIADTQTRRASRPSGPIGRGHDQVTTEHQFTRTAPHVAPDLGDRGDRHPAEVLQEVLQRIGPDVFLGLQRDLTDVVPARPGPLSRVQRAGSPRAVPCRTALVSIAAGFLEHGGGQTVAAGRVVERHPQDGSVTFSGPFAHDP
jgi:hypothetical protein